jgi:ankyrin repeat protein
LISLSLSLYLGNRTETRGNSAANNVQERKQPNSEACQGLFTAVELNDALTLRELLDGGDVDKDSTDKNGNTPLHVAAEMGHKAVAQVGVSAYTSTHLGGTWEGCTYMYSHTHSARPPTTEWWNWLRLEPGARAWAAERESSVFRHSLDKSDRDSLSLSP